MTSYLAIAAGELSTVTDVVARLTGHPARTVAEHLRAASRGLGAPARLDPGIRSPWPRRSVPRRRAATSCRTDKPCAS